MLVHLFECFTQKFWPYLTNSTLNQVVLGATRTTTSQEYHSHHVCASRKQKCVILLFFVFDKKEREKERVREKLKEMFFLHQASFSEFTARWYLQSPIFHKDILQLVATDFYALSGAIGVCWNSKTSEIICKFAWRGFLSSNVHLWWNICHTAISRIIDQAWGQ